MHEYDNVKSTTIFSTRKFLFIFSSNSSSSMPLVLLYVDKAKQTRQEKINEGKSIMVTYDVFLSFRGIDTRNNFTGNLYNYLQHQRGIQTFIDDEKIKKGKQITHTLLQAIKESRIFVAIISPNYASSTFCLNELVAILECSKLQGRVFMPVFYDVDPSHVRNITGTYAEAFAKHEVRFRGEKEKVQKWKDALHEAASFCGWHFIPGSGYEYKFIGEIVEDILEKIAHEEIDEFLQVSNDFWKEIFDDLEKGCDDLEDGAKEFIDDLEEGCDDLEEGAKEIFDDLCDDLEEGVKGIFLNIAGFFDS